MATMQFRYSLLNTNEFTLNRPMFSQHMSQPLLGHSPEQVLADRQAKAISQLLPQRKCPSVTRVIFGERRDPIDVSVTVTEQEIRNNLPTGKHTQRHSRLTSSTSYVEAYIPKFHARLPSRRSHIFGGGPSLDTLNFNAAFISQLQESNSVFRLLKLYKRQQRRKYTL